MVGGVAQPVVGRLAPRHDHAKCVVVTPPHRVVALGKQRSEHLGADAGHRQQDGRIGRLSGRWLVLRGRVGVVRRSSHGELMHQPVELASRVIELSVDQGEAFGEEPHMRSGSFARARCQLDGRRA